MMAATRRTRAGSGWAAAQKASSGGQKRGCVVSRMRMGERISGEPSARQSPWRVGRAPPARRSGNELVTGLDVEHQGLFAGLRRGGRDVDGIVIGAVGNGSGVGREEGGIVVRGRGGGGGGHGA